MAEGPQPDPGAAVPGRHPAQPLADRLSSVQSPEIVELAVATPNFPKPSPAPPPPTMQELPNELLEEIFLRIPPDEPEWLVRASLASNFWLARLTGPAFRGRYGDLHGAAPMLGFLLSYHYTKNYTAPRLVSTGRFGARVPDPDWEHTEYEPVDCRHGRVLLADNLVKLAVWDPMTGCRRDLEKPGECLMLGAAAVLCAVTGCDHSSCHRGPFRVLLFGLNMLSEYGGEHRAAHMWLRSSETEEWSQPCSPLQLGSQDALIKSSPSLLFENAIYHTLWYPHGTAILKYDIASSCMSLLDGPPFEDRWTAQKAILMAMEDDGVGFTYLDCSALYCCTLYRWSRQIRSDGVTTWTHRTLVNLNKLLHIQHPKRHCRLVGFKEGSTGIVFVSTDLGIYEINLKSLEWKKLWKREDIRALIPYITFYNPPERVNPL